MISGIALVMLGAIYSLVYYWIETGAIIATARLGRIEREDAASALADQLEAALRRAREGDH